MVPPVDMPKRYGFGDYERNDVDVRTSTWELRLDFLNTLVRIKADSLLSLFAIAKWDSLPSDLVLPDKFPTTFCAVFLYLFRGDPLNTPIDPVFLDTPLNHHQALIKHISADVSARMTENAKLRNRISQVDRQKIALNEVLTGWEVVREMPAAQNLRMSMEAWAVEHNLCEDWVMDFLLLALNSLYVVAMVPSAEPLTENDLKTINARKVLDAYTWRVEQAVKDAILEFHRYKITSRLWDVSADMLETDTFLFATSGVEWIRRTWHPNITSRTEFVDETKRSFELFRAALLDLDNFETINVTEFETLLDDYCDEVLKTPGKPLPPFQYLYQGELPILQATWNTDKQSRAAFISGCLRKIKTNFRRFKKVAPKIRLLPKDALDLAVYAYCNRVERTIPENYSKNPVKSAGIKHFRWLVSYQVPPVRTFRAIADSEPTPKPTEAAVKKAIMRLARRIALQLRPGLKTGRPRGVIEKKPRNRAR